MAVGGSGGRWGVGWEWEWEWAVGVGAVGAVVEMAVGVVVAVVNGGVSGSGGGGDGGDVVVYIDWPGHLEFRRVPSCDVRVGGLRLGFEGRLELLFSNVEPPGAVEAKDLAGHAGALDSH